MNDWHFVFLRGRGFAVLRGAGRMVIVKSLFNCGEQILTLWNWYYAFMPSYGEGGFEILRRAAAIVWNVIIFDVLIMLLYEDCVLYMVCDDGVFAWGLRAPLHLSRWIKVQRWPLIWREGGICNSDILVIRFHNPTPLCNPPAGKYSCNPSSLCEELACEISLRLVISNRPVFALSTYHIIFGTFGVI